ncbi:ParB/RepB/Spo0J family partition protein [Campylobacter novaezeelandiae]|uniref:ParB/RepB/Spo0J family partition protein n=1 Tax=Campylobacter novaezeelandiae TaxID=2267891 RepID=A0A4V2JQQ9_9BACT|nr:ParB/RepB/Spo0J family partition protein [Campylobacter novaezeelandiae]TBR79267.1 ParB/RepB/Spo0J family partition protein [Campylobacter novaezeelandiae]TBR81972.1 ParB/RepB/Spo0J family partition protein [Campylobacter novaezeelandiae]
MGLNKNKGLATLIGDMDEVYSKELGLDKNKTIQIPVEKIKINPFQPRKYFNKEALDELANSIKQYGLIQPIIVLKQKDHYTLVAGERRLRAYKMLGYENILALVSDAKEEKLRELALIENIQRENLNPIELANSYKDLIEVYEITQENLASLVNKSRAQITNTLRLLNLDSSTQKLIIEGKISQGHAKILVGLNKKDEKMITNSIIGQQLSVHDTEKIVKKIKNQETINLENDLEFETEFKELIKLLNNKNFKCKKSKKNLIIHLKNIDIIKKLKQIIEKIN